MNTLQLPVVTLTVLGMLVTLLGVFAAGSLEMMVVGLGAVGFAGLLAAIGTRRGTA